MHTEKIKALPEENLTNREAAEIRSAYPIKRSGREEEEEARLEIEQWGMYEHDEDETDDEGLQVEEDEVVIPPPPR